MMLIPCGHLEAEGEARSDCDGHGLEICQLHACLLQCLLDCGVHGCLMSLLSQLGNYATPCCMYIHLYSTAPAQSTRMW